MEINPILRRESRVLWRGDRPFILLLLYALALSVLIALIYESNRIGEANFNTRTTSDGAALFHALSYLGLGTWLLVVPITAAPMLALERERGLLEALQLSGIPPWRIVAGKFVAVLSFSLLLWLAGAPPLAICFYLGGVSPQEWIAALGLQLATIITGAALGLFVSSRSRRVQTALRDSILLVAAWIVLSHFSEEIASGFFNSVRWLFSGWISPNMVMNTILYSGYFDPFGVLEGVFLEASPAIPRPFMPMGAPVAASDILPVHFRLQAVAALVFLWRATVNAGRALPEAQWVERRRYLTLRNGRIKSTPATPQNGKQPKEQSVFDVPLVTLLRFQNPVLQREVRGLFRLRRFSLLTKILLAFIIIAAIIGYVMALLFAWAEPNSRPEVWRNLITVLFFGVLIAAPLRGANAIARERENGTWEALRLSHLEPHTILRGKALAPLVFLACVCLIALPVWLPCINWMGPGDDVSLLFALAAASLLFATTFSFTSWGLWISWRCRSAAAATGWTFGTVIIGTFFISNLGPILVHWCARLLGWLYAALTSLFLGISIPHPLHDNYYGAYGYSSGPIKWIYNFFTEACRFLNPLQEMSALRFPTRYSGYYREDYGWLTQPAHAFVAAGVQVLIGCLILLDISRRMKKSRFVEEETAKRGTRKAKEGT